MAGEGRLAWMKFYPGDFLADDRVACMTLAARGAHIFLLCHAWRAGGHLPAEDAALARLSGAYDEWPSIRDQVLAAWSRQGDMIVQKRLAEEHARATEAHERSVVTGSQGGRKRAENARLAQGGLEGALRNPQARASDSDSDSLPTEVSSASELRTSGRSRSAPSQNGSILGNPRYGIVYDRTKRKLLGVTDEMLAEWRAAYPACDVPLEIKRAEQWLASETAKGKKQNYRKFMTNWLARSQERGGEKRGQRTGGGDKIGTAPTWEMTQRQWAEEDARKKGEA